MNPLSLFSPMSGMGGGLSSANTNASGIGGNSQPQNGIGAWTVSVGGSGAGSASGQTTSAGTLPKWLWPAVFAVAAIWILRK